MTPAITTLDYLWRFRNTWLRHHSECTCAFEKLASQHIESSITVDQWCEIRVVNGIPSMEMIRMAPEDWDEICGPSAERRQLQQIIDAHMEEVTKIMSIQAETERLSSE